MSRTNKIHHISCHVTCICKCRLYASICNDVMINNVEVMIDADMNAKN